MGRRPRPCRRRGWRRGRPRTASDSSTPSDRFPTAVNVTVPRHPLSEVRYRSPVRPTSGHETASGPGGCTRSGLVLDLQLAETGLDDSPIETMPASRPRRRRRAGGGCGARSSTTSALPPSRLAAHVTTVSTSPTPRSGPALRRRGRPAPGRRRARTRCRRCGGRRRTPRVRRPLVAQLRAGVGQRHLLSDRGDVGPLVTEDRFDVHVDPSRRVGCGAPPPFAAPSPPTSPGEVRSSRRSKRWPSRSRFVRRYALLSG